MTTNWAEVLQFIQHNFYEVENKQLSSYFWQMHEFIFKKNNVKNIIVMFLLYSEQLIHVRLLIIILYAIVYKMENDDLQVNK